MVLHDDVWLEKRGFKNQRRRKKVKREKKVDETTTKKLLESTGKTDVPVKQKNQKKREPVKYRIGK